MSTTHPELLVPRVRIRRFQDQPRTYFDEREMNELTESIREIGQKVAIIVKPVQGDPLHDLELVDGERRWIACGRANVELMSVVVRTYEDDEDQYLDSIIANSGRAEHTGLESARAVDRVLKSKRMEQYPRMERVERVARAFSRSVPWVYERIAILNLPEEVQEMMDPKLPEEEQLGHTMAVFISKKVPKDLQVSTARVVVDKQMSVTQARLYCTKVAGVAGMKFKTTKKPGGLPSRSWERLEILTRVVSDGLDVLLQPLVQEALRKHNAQELVLMATEIDQLSARFRQLRESLLASGVEAPKPSTVASTPATQPAPLSAPSSQVGKVQSFSIEQAANQLGVSRRTIYSRIRDGSLRTIRTLGGSQRVIIE